MRTTPRPHSNKWTRVLPLFRLNLFTTKTLSLSFYLRYTSSSSTCHVPRLPIPRGPPTPLTLPPGSTPRPLSCPSFGLTRTEVPGTCGRETRGKTSLKDTEPEEVDTRGDLSIRPRKSVVSPLLWRVSDVKQQSESPSRLGTEVRKGSDTRSGLVTPLYSLHVPGVHGSRLYSFP